MIQAKKVVTSLQDPKNKAMVIGLGFLTLLVIGCSSYRWYAIHRGQKAQLILGECLQEYVKASQSEQALWSEIQLMSDLGFNQASGTALQPFFLVMQAQAFAHQSKMDEAVDHMQQAIDMLSVSSPYKGYFALTKSLMQLDMPDKDKRLEGFRQLQLLADNKDNMYRDAALYHVGGYYYANNDFTQAKEAWHKLIAQKKDFVDSPWVEQAEQKVATI